MSGYPHVTLQIFFTSAKTCNIITTSEWYYYY